MSTLQDIKGMVQQLSPEHLADFRDWFTEFDLRNPELRLRFIREQQLEFLRTHPRLARAFQGERLIARLTGGELTAYAASHDVTLHGNIKVEVKSSRVSRVTKHGHRRWQWNSIDGFRNKGKDYDLLLLIGDADPEFQDQYPKGSDGLPSPWVFFLVPHERVPDISHKSVHGSQTYIGTNLGAAREKSTPYKLKSYIVSMREIEILNTKAIDP